MMMPLRRGALLLFLLLSLSGCGTLRGLLTPPPAPPTCEKPTPPPAELFAPVPAPSICYRIATGEDHQDCGESALGALAACNSKLAKAGEEINKGEAE